MALVARLPQSRRRLLLVRHGAPRAITGSVTLAVVVQHRGAQRSRRRRVFPVRHGVPRAITGSDG